MLKFSYLKSINAEYIDELFSLYLKSPELVDPSWRYFFDGLELGASEVSPLKNGHAAPVIALAPAPRAEASVSGVDLAAEARVVELIQTYRERGKWLAQLDPLEPAPSKHPELELSAFGLKDDDLSRVFQAGKIIGLGAASLKEIITHLKATYCRSIGAEVSHIEDRAMKSWLQGEMEKSKNTEALDPETRKFILKRLSQSETFERFLHTRYVAQKRFSIEGGESLIPALDRIVEEGAELGAEQFVLGMAHRGRLNVLVNIYGKKPQYIFTEFEDKYEVDLSKGEGDVKYHMGYSQDFVTRKGKAVHLSMASNPSHLEFVNPVVEGIARCKQRYLGDMDRKKVVPILIHGDAAFAGQGVVYETIAMANLEAYTTGGTIHIVANNQVGFTTSPDQARSTRYCTDLAKMMDVPIFHVNGDDAEAVWYVLGLATRFRQKFGKDVFIDLVCYRKYGHNEGDEPAFTQPVMYKKIKTHPSPRELYAQRLVDLGVVTDAVAKAEVDRLIEDYSQAQEMARAENKKHGSPAYEAHWKQLHPAKPGEVHAVVETRVDADALRLLSQKINKMPAGFNLHPKLTRFFEARFKAVDEGKGIDWGNGESLAYATLLSEGHTVRISGQDAERGTFTHRHAVLHDFENGASYTPLKSIESPMGEFLIYNSFLSETAVMGFEYGWSLADPNSLTIWEAQFGDFANGAQVIIDQFLAAAESKWQRSSGLVLFLPHGYEGQGPEHSSARLERFLQLCGKQNMSICNFTTPAQLFHALRRQLRWNFRKPMIVMTPKSLLRHPQAISTIEEFSDGHFQEALDDPFAIKAQVQKVILCSGKIYYDLLAEREARSLRQIALIRVEQLYPWPADLLHQIMQTYPADALFCWVQEEPRNMGAWTHVFNQWSGGYEYFQDRVAGRPIQYIGRDIGAAPAVGSARIHVKEQKEIIEKALSLT